MAMPSGLRSSEPIAGAEGQRHAGKQRRHGRHHDGPEAQQAGLVDGVGRVLSMLALASSAKSTIMMPFFFTMPISRTMSDDGDDAQVLMKKDQRQERAHAGRRQRGKNRDGMDEALVEHAQHDVDRDQGGEDQQRLHSRASSGRTRPCPGNRPAGSPACCMSLLHSWSMASIALPSATPWAPD